VRLEDELSPNQHSYESWSDFIYRLPTEQSLLHEGESEPGESRTKINTIIAGLLMGSWGIIMTCRHLELESEKRAKNKETEERGKKFNKRTHEPKAYY